MGQGKTRARQKQGLPLSSLPRKTAGLWRRFAVSLQIYLSGARYRAKVRTPHRKAKRVAINEIRYT